MICMLVARECSVLLSKHCAQTNDEEMSESIRITPDYLFKPEVVPATVERVQLPCKVERSSLAGTRIRVISRVSIDLF